MENKKKEKKNSKRRDEIVEWWEHWNWFFVSTSKAEAAMSRNIFLFFFDTVRNTWNALAFKNIQNKKKKKQLKRKRSETKQ